MTGPVKKLPGVRDRPLKGIVPLEITDGLKRTQMISVGSLLVILVLILTLAVWLLHFPGSVMDPLVAAAKTCAFLAISTLALNYVLAARWKFMEDLFSGLDRMYRVHKFVGRSSLVFMLLHPVFLGLSKLPATDHIPEFILPSTNWSISFGVIAIYLFILLLLLTVTIKVPYHLWHISHKFLGIVLVLSLLHAVLAGSDMEAYPILRFWIILLSCFGIVSYLYMLLFYKRLGPRYDVKISKVSHLREMTELFLERPEGFDYHPGQYIFIRFPKFREGGELFPFSISTDPSQELIRLSIRRSGDFTSEKIPHLKKGDKAVIMGPYGKFGERYLRHEKDMLWIAGGIGITPFLSLAKHESLFPTGRKINLIWVFKDPKDPFHDSELFSEARKNKDFDYIHWISGKKGRIDAEKIIDLIGGEQELRKRVVMMCGPPGMMRALSKQFCRHGVHRSNIMFEDFDMLD